jgi:hypothetical protein
MGRAAKDANNYTPTVVVSQQAKNALTRWLKENRNPHQGQTVGRIIEWFVRQPRIVQQVVLGEVPIEMNIAYAAAMRELANQAEAGAGDGGMPLREAAMPIPKGGMDIPGGKRRDKGE